MNREKFNQEYFSSGSYGEYEKEIVRWVPKTAKKIAKIIGKRKAKILDVGCAHGFLIAELKKEYGYDVAGIDYSDFAVQNAETSVKKKIRRGDILKLPYKKNSFDAVICLDVINYLEYNEVAEAINNLVNISRKYIFFGAIFKHAWTASQKWNPDKYRKSALTKKEYIGLFRKNKAKFVSSFDGENGGSILIFKK